MGAAILFPISYKTFDGPIRDKNGCLLSSIFRPLGGTPHEENSIFQIHGTFSHKKPTRLCAEFTNEYDLVTVAFIRATEWWE